MKLIIATALAVFAIPAVAQETPTAPPPPPAPQTMPPAAPMAMPAAPGGIVMGAPSPVVQPLPDTATAPADGSTPWCTRTVVDHCKERSDARGRRLHTTPRPPGA